MFFFVFELIKEIQKKTKEKVQTKNAFTQTERVRRYSLFGLKPPG